MKKKVTTNTEPFVIAEYLYLRKVMKAITNCTNEQMIGDTHRNGSFSSLKVHGVGFTKEMLIKINDAFKTKFVSHLQVETYGGAFVFSKVV